MLLFPPRRIGPRSSSASRRRKTGGNRTLPGSRPAFTSLRRGNLESFRGWWEMLVTLQFVASDTLFSDSRFTVEQPDHFPWWSCASSGCGGGSCAHGGRAYEARLNLIRPAMKWWSRWVMLPHQLACKASALLVCHDPRKMAGHLGAAPSELSFGDSVAQAGARPVKSGYDWKTTSTSERARQSLRHG